MALSRFASTSSVRWEDPLLDDGVRGWINLTARRQFWRVAPHYQLEDLIQDGYMCFANLRKKYPDIKDPKHVMGLFKRIYTNHITDLANARTAGSEIPFSQMQKPDESEEHLLDNLLGSETELGPIMAAVAHAPQELKDLFSMFASDVGRSVIERPHRIDRKGMRETTNSKLCRILGLDPSKVNLRRMFEVQFMGGEEQLSWENFLVHTLRQAQSVLDGPEGMIEKKEA